MNFLTPHSTDSHDIPSNPIFEKHQAGKNGTSFCHPMRALLNNLLESLINRDDSQTYQLLKQAEQVTPSSSSEETTLDSSSCELWEEILMESLELPVELFQLVYEFVTSYYTPSTLRRSYSFYSDSPKASLPETRSKGNSIMAKEMTNYNSVPYATIAAGFLELACAMASPENVAYLLRRQFPRDESSLILFGDISRIPSPSLLAFALTTGNMGVIELLLNTPDQIQPQDSALRTMVLLGLYLPTPSDNEDIAPSAINPKESVEHRVNGIFTHVSAPFTLGLKWSAERIAEEVYHLSTLPLYSLEGFDAPPNPLFPYSVPMELSDWVVPQGWVAPLEVLRHWFSTGRYGRKEALEIIHSYEEVVPFKWEQWEKHWRIFGLSGIFLRYVPEIGKEPDFVQFLFESDFYSKMEFHMSPFTLFNFEGWEETVSGVILEEQVMEDLRVGATQMNQPMKISSKTTVTNFLVGGNDVQERILQLLHHTCGVELCGEALTTPLPVVEDLPDSSFSLLLECCARDKTLLEHCGFIAQTIVRDGSMDYLKKALKNGLLEGEPWPEFIQLLKDNHRYNLLPVAETNNPNPYEEYPL